MSSFAQANLAEAAADECHLLELGAYNPVHRDIWGPRELSMADSRSVTNPDGVILMRLAENNLLHEEVASFIKHKVLLFIAKSSALDSAFSSFDLQHWTTWQIEILELCNDNGVMITPGSVYETE
ncbi:hypothetical protein FSARC_14689 [Fusarium sarcochroum]|uniref:Uncharacterized protein n=1 Tax=Fusarium sarcochroum TaxID=1208366 RepID=A0A8H4SRU1_9HYPO|nr:hypothetical protein FSARC_14689 [Fusarium sarcochroum]